MQPLCIALIAYGEFNKLTTSGTTSHRQVVSWESLINFYDISVVYKTGLLIFCGKKAKFRGIFRGKFAEKSANFAGFLREKSQNSQKNRPTSREFSRISRDFAEIPEFRGSATAQNIRSPDKSTNHGKLLLICFLAITLTLWRPFPLKFLGKSRAQKREQQTASPSYHFHAQTLINHMALDQSVCEKSLSYGKNICWRP